MPHTPLLLSHCLAGQVCQISALKGDLSMKLRLVNLGFHTHSVIEVILIRGHNVVLSVDGSRFALDRAIAHNIEVERLV
ncbi:FeoA family protein [Thiomicrorhabdus aquaedulcis]|uniref:FeoA family protein n=1 Tax=Thiomicrorhabdus aquaedulcis TaxID=2211106 RepID=UPI000FD7C6CF|nr:FeoA family protein [Thiomicrorhabdus aquaedulcis]